MSKSFKEIELKLEVSSTALDQLKRSGAPKDFSSSKAVTRALQSIYFDTPDQALRRARISLRVRKVGRNWIQTAKLGTGVAGGLSSAVEAEHPVAGRALDFTVIDDPQVLKTLVETIDGAVLNECFETVMRRTTRQLTSETDGSEIEVAFDVGEIKAGENKRDLVELELELKSGKSAALYAAARGLLGNVPFRFSPYNKAERGFRLAGGEDADTHLPVPAAPVELRPDEIVELAYRDVLRSCLGQIANNRLAVLATDDPEGPHQFRIGLRRLRSAMRLFKPVLNSATFKSLDVVARSLAMEAGHLRDLDVLAGEVVAPLQTVAPDGLSLDALRTHLGSMREGVRANLSARLVQPDVNGFLFDLADYTEGRGWLDPENFGQTSALAESVRRYSGKALDYQWKKVSRYGSRIDDLTIPERHDMRKALKKLRYGAEFFGSLYPGSDIKPFLKRMKKLQDIFGYLNDVAMAEKLVSLQSANGKASAPVSLATGFVIGWHEAQSTVMWPRAKGCWLDTKKAPKFWR